MRLRDKVAIVTGASGGIGQGIAAVFAEEGARVVCVARGDVKRERRRPRRPSSPARRTCHVSRLRRFAGAARSTR